mmetsp:Transcript_17600/g.57532  ORF Transcript_17600/g.57532 Transcript_17600/m.57532 type:complete len:200 (-) Transcript_17600:349-948(-)
MICARSDGLNALRRRARRGDASQHPDSPAVDAPSAAYLLRSDVRAGDDPLEGEPIAHLVGLRLCLWAALARSGRVPPERLPQVIVALHPPQRLVGIELTVESTEQAGRDQAGPAAPAPAVDVELLPVLDPAVQHTHDRVEGVQRARRLEVGQPKVQKGRVRSGGVPVAVEVALRPLCALGEVWHALLWPRLGLRRQLVL